MELKQVLGEHTDDIRFTGVFVYDRNLAFIRAQLNSLNSKGIDHTVMIRYKDGDWGQYIVEAPSTSHCLMKDPDLKVFLLVPDGNIHVASKQGFSWEKIDTKSGGANSLKALTEIRIISGKLYTVGMGRMIYRRDSIDNWSRFDKGINETPNLDPISGFKSINGFDATEMYAVGFKGEIWFFEENQWKPASSPTNLKLESIICTTGGQVFSCGASGLLLQGRRDVWNVIDHGLTTNTLWSIEEFDGSVFFADSIALYRYDKHTSEKVNIVVGKSISCSYLHANDGVLWSVGENNIARYDGQNWEVLF
ncbi:conserved hypothetical protein [Candidatus Methylobacter favarea]|uniref:Uncharacterized protein n=1 Tax=Candidatus Methylobacter favarea TaxID=2707345 RepID=A0A8S0WHA9_9GAMM|nr:hypothetical protein [Candidatus Methylobacter favarea]CAA9889669.1 conserved hypothetical protein [Candidatus Methylobacter favarea]